MLRRIVLTIMVLVAIGYLGRAVAAPPRVVKAVPDNGEVGVDPGLQEIRVTFDQAMDRRGMSVVGGGESFPELLGQPRWQTSRTIVIRVQLQPNHDYSLSINSDRFRNFTSRAGEPAVPYPIRFRTGPGSGGGAATGDEATLTAADNQRAINLLRSAMLNHYSYADRLGIDWNELLQKHRDALLKSTTPEDFARTAGVVLAQAKDKHIWLKVGDQTIPSYVNPVVPNANFRLLPQIVPGWQMHGRRVASGRWHDGIGYLLIDTWSQSNDDVVKAAVEALGELRDAPGLVIDVRGNGGGSEPLAAQVAGCFVETRRLYAKHVYRDPDRPGGFTAPRERWLEPNQEQPTYRGRVAVLTGPVVMSSCEAFLLMMKQVPGAVLVGAPSQGASGNPKPHDLENGVTVFLPSWKSMTPDGHEFEGQGIAPDIEVHTTPQDFATSDPVLDAALAHLRQAVAE